MTSASIAASISGAGTITSFGALMPWFALHCGKHAPSQIFRASAYSYRPASRTRVV
jgi:hypothetical protein